MKARRPGSEWLTPSGKMHSGAAAGEDLAAKLQALHVLAQVGTFSHVGAAMKRHDAQGAHRASAIAGSSRARSWR